MKTIFLIRCTGPDTRTISLFNELSAIFGNDSVHFIVDAYGKDERTVSVEKEKFPMNALMLTDEFVKEAGLHFDSGKTGWCCGDYVFYKAFSIDWDFAWVIEPDVFLINGAMRKFIELESDKSDVITTDFLPADEKWFWKKRFKTALPDHECYKMLFPLVRLSRSLAEEAFKLRKKATLNSDKERFEAPNDESIVASAAYTAKASILDLKQTDPELFEYWGTTIRVPMGDVRKRKNSPLIIHSGLENDDFKVRMTKLWSQCIDGDAVQGYRMLRSLQNADQQTIIEFVDSLIYWTKDRLSNKQ